MRKVNNITKDLIIEDKEFKQIVKENKANMKIINSVIDIAEKFPVKGYITVQLKNGFSFKSKLNEDDLEVCKNNLEVYLSNGEKKFNKDSLTIDIITALVLDEFNITYSQILTTRRYRPVIHYKQCIHYLCSKYTKLSGRVIGEEVGNVSPATVSNSSDTVKDTLLLYPYWRRHIEKLEKKLS